MLNIYSVSSSLNNSILAPENRIITLSEARAELLVPVRARLNEGAIGSAAELIASIFRKIREFLVRIYRMIFGEKKSKRSSSSSYSGGSSSGSSSSGSGYRASDRAKPRQYRRDPNYPYREVYGWSANDADAIRRKLCNPYFAEHFIWELHDWNNYYIDHMSENVDKLDSVRIRLPGGKKIDSSVSSILSEINDYIFNYQSAGRNPKEYDTYVSYFKSDVDRAIERIFSISDGSAYSTQIMDKVANGPIRRSTKSYHEIMDIVSEVENEEDNSDQIEDKYKTMISSLEEAEENINRIDLSTAPEEVVNVVSALSEFLQYKVSVISAIENIHIKAIRERSEEYKSELKRFNNM